MFTAIDTHTGGEPTRVVVAGVPEITGRTMVDKRKMIESQFDYVRTALLHEPRGHSDMFGSIITTAASKGADLGVIFMDGNGYLDMCIHGTIGSATVALEMGLVPIKEPTTTLTVDTPAGIVTANAVVKNGSVNEISIMNVPCFSYASKVFKIPRIGDVPVDIAFGGNFFAIVDAKTLGISVKPANVSKLRAMGLSIRDAVNSQIRVYHPEKPFIKAIELVEICDSPSIQGADSKNVVIFGAGQIDRSPCGTGTCAKMATLHARGELDLGEEFVNESIIGAVFKGRLVKKTRVGKFRAVVPEVSGRAFITGIQQFMIEKDDPLKYGFRLA